MKRIVSVWSPNWPITSWRLRTPADRTDAPTCALGSAPNPARTGAPPADPFALVESVKGARRLAAVDAAAEAAGLWPGQKLADAQALTPGLRTAESDPAADRKGLAALADACARFSPAVAVDAPDGLLLDMTGGAHLWGGEAGALRAIAARLQGWGVPVRLGLADTAGAAWALARYGDGLAIAPPGEQAAALLPMPVEALRLAPDLAASLRRLGLKTVEQTAGLPRAQLARRFAPELLLRLDQALGRADEALTFRRPPSLWVERIAFAEPISTLEDFTRALGDVARALCLRLDGGGQGGRRWEAAFHRVDGQVFTVRVGTALPNRTPARLTALFAPRLEAIDPGFGIEVVTLRADRVEPLAAAQTSLDARAEDDADLAALIDRLGARLGEDQVWRAAPFESHVPERALVRGPATDTPAAGWDPDRPRPMRLLSRPEPIEAMAPVPDDPPAVFTWRGVRRRVRRAEGPERIAEEWWRDPTTEPDHHRVRDYYAVEDADGARFWLFRAGLYGAPDAPRWFLHGLFG
jgi:protein ImuB